MKAGLPIISTDTYALPELVTHGHNGFLCANPIPFFNKDGSPNEEYSGLISNRITRERMFEEVEADLLAHMRFFMSHPEERVEFGLRSLRRANKPPFDDRSIRNAWLDLLKTAAARGTER